MGKLTTHALDTYHGRPASGLSLELFRLDAGQGRMLLAGTQTNADGRVDAPLLEGDALIAGEYELVFMVRDYFASRGVESPFLDRIPVGFTVFDASQNYHVPLLFTPWSYSTYRGS
jgi:5-hydroxyisourate hydrolase